MTTAAWLDQAACRGTDLRQWFPRQASAATLQTCHGCPVRAECLDEALQHEAPTTRAGIWGGLTVTDRAAIPDLQGPRADRLAALRAYIADHHPSPERTPEMTTPHTSAPIAAGATEALPVGQLLAWGDKYPDAAVQDQAARARLALEALRRRHAADSELTAIASEAEELEKRLQELRTREAELAPPKRKAGRKTQRDYDAREVRAWAAENDVECPRKGQIPRRVLDAWRARDTGAQAA
ncbi:MAG: WhiB family transcriptional regulator [Pseudonocardia sp.]